MSIKEEIHALTDEMLTNLGRLVAIDSQLGTPAEGMPFGEGPAKALEVGLKIADELGFKTVNLDNYCGYAETVSYTHLDVYKRQCIDFLDSWHGEVRSKPTALGENLESSVG